MLLVRQARQDDARPMAGRHGCDGLSEHALGEFGEKVLLEDLQAALFPGDADELCQACHGVLDKMLKPLARQPLTQGVRKGVRIVPPDQLDEVAEAFVCLVRLRGAPGR